MLLLTLSRMWLPSPLMKIWPSAIYSGPTMNGAQYLHSSQYRKETDLKDRWNNALKDKVFSNMAELKKKLEQLEKNAENLKQLAKEGAAILPDAVKEQLEENTEISLKKAAKEGNVEDIYSFKNIYILSKKQIRFRFSIISKILY